MANRPNNAFHRLYGRLIDDEAFVLLLSGAVNHAHALYEDYEDAEGIPVKLDPGVLREVTVRCLRDLFAAGPVQDARVVEPEFHPDLPVTWVKVEAVTP